MSARFDGAVWSGIERRLGAVERFIPDAPPWRAAADLPDVSGIVRAGSAFRRAERPQASPRRRLILVLVVIGTLLALVGAAILVGGLRSDEAREDLFGPFGQLRQADGRATAALLHDGRVLIVSGEWVGIGNASRRADIWDPDAGFSSIAPPTVGRVNPSVTLLLDGRVLVIGGFGGPYQYASSATASAEVWDPATSTFAPTENMAAARVGHTATLLSDGRVLVVGGDGPEGDSDQAEVWDPQTNQFTPAGLLAHSRMGHAAALLLDGRVVVVGGRDPATGAGLAPVEVWDPASRTFTVAMSLGDGRNLEPSSTSSPTSPSLIRLEDGRVLIVGAFVLPYDAYRGVVLWNPATGARHDLEMASHRDGHAATLLADGRVLVSGGRTSDGEVLATAELWDPADNLFRDAAPLARPAASHTALALADGRVLIVLDGSGPEGIIEPFLYEPEPIP